MATLLRDARTGDLDAAMKAGQASGMQSIDQALDRLVQQRRVSAEIAAPLYLDADAADRTNPT